MILPIHWELIPLTDCPLIRITVSPVFTPELSAGDPGFTLDTVTGFVSTRLSPYPLTLSLQTESM